MILMELDEHGPVLIVELRKRWGTVVAGQTRVRCRELLARMFNRKNLHAVGPRHGKPVVGTIDANFRFDRAEQKNVL